MLKLCGYVLKIFLKHYGCVHSNFGLLFARKLVFGCVKLCQKILEVEVVLCYKFAKFFGCFVATILWNLCVNNLRHVPLGEWSSCALSIVHCDCIEFEKKNEKILMPFKPCQGAIGFNLHLFVTRDGYEGYETKVLKNRLSQTRL